MLFICLSRISQTVLPFLAERVQVQLKPTKAVASSPWVVCIEVQREPFFEKKVFFAQSRAKDKDKGHTLGTACHLYDC